MELNGVSFSDSDFFQQQREAERGWIQPVCFALVFHFVTLALSATLPGLINRRPILDEVVTVNLVSLPEMTPAPRQKTPQKAPPPKQQEPPVKIEPAKGKIPIAVLPEVVPEKAPSAKPVSLKPSKRKLRKSDPAKLAAEQEKRRQQQQRQKEDLARARQEAERAALEAQKIKADWEAQKARAALAEMIRRQGAQTSSSSGSSSGRRDVLSIVEKQYYSSLIGQVQQYWALPEMRQWDASLETVVVLTIRNNGTVARKIIEKKSKDPFFDQFVMKTLQKAVPLPRFPKLMTQSSIEVGLRFKPGQLLTM